jgi:RNA polymerase sigma-70 factor, ECF subfamily
MNSTTEIERQGTDEALVVRYQRGDRAAFARLVERHGAAVYAVARYMLDDPEQAAEVARATFLDLSRSAGSFHIETPFRPWLFGFLHRRLGVSDEKASASTTPPASRPPPSPVMEEPASPSSRAPRSFAIGRRVAEQVATLPALTREILTLKLKAQLSIREIASATSSTTDEIGQRLRAGLEAIQSVVSDTEDYARALR